MTKKILSSLILGIVAGAFFLGQKQPGYLDLINSTALGVLLVTVGFDLGCQEKLGQELKKLSKVALLVPFLGAIGSIIGVLLVGSLLGLTIKDASLVGVCFGWYSLPSIIIGQTYDLTVGTLALLANVFREILAIVLIPLVAGKFGPFSAVAVGGATAMDVTLPIIVQNTNVQTTLVAIYSGLILSLLALVIVPLLIRIM